MILKKIIIPFRGNSKEKRLIDISGDFDFSCLEIRPTENPKFWFFYNGQERCFVDTFILNNQPQVQKICRITLIADSESNLVPRFDFFIWDKQSKKVISVQEMEEKYVKAKVNLENDGSKNFWKLVGFLSSTKNIKFDTSEKYKILKSDEEIAEILKNKDKASAILSLLKDDDVQNLNFMIGANKLAKILETWEDNKTNTDEEFWQKEFEANPWLISQIFACPYIFIEGKPFFGGKRTNNKGGVCGDLLFKNIKTNNAAFIEIKTPETLLLKGMYRGKDSDDNNSVYSVSEDISGGIVQILNQRSMQLQKADSLEADYENINSKCILIAGNTEKLNQAQKRSLDLFRNSNKDVEVITFDELFERIEMMKSVFQNDNDLQVSCEEIPTINLDEEEIPTINLDDEIPETRLEDVPF